MINRIIAAVVLVGSLALAPLTAGASTEAMKALGIFEMRQPTTAPDVTLQTLTGASIAMKNLLGKAVLVNFWATWCTPCQWEMPLMENLYRAYKDRGFVILAISIDQGNADGVRAFVKDRKLTYPVALDPRHEAARQFGVTGLPATLLVGPDGYIKGVTYGPKEWDGKEARAVIESLLPRRRAGVAR